MSLIMTLLSRPELSSGYFYTYTCNIMCTSDMVTLCIPFFAGGGGGGGGEVGLYMQSLRY